MKRWFSMAVVTGMLLTGAGAWAGSAHQLGAGAHYWTTVDDVELDNIDNDGIGWFLTYRWDPSGILGIELDAEMLPDDFAGATEEVYAPVGYVVLGGWIYVAAGIGNYYTDGEWFEDPFYALKAGLNLELLPNIYVDLSGDYRFTEWDDTVVDNLDSDTITAALAIRIGL